MGKKIFCICPVLIFCIFIFGHAFATTNCKQTVTFLGMTLGANPTSWTIEDLSGECSDSYLIQIAIFDSNITLITTDMRLQYDLAAYFDGY